MTRFHCGIVSNCSYRILYVHLHARIPITQPHKFIGNGVYPFLHIAIFSRNALNCTHCQLDIHRFSSRFIQSKLNSIYDQYIESGEFGYVHGWSCSKDVYMIYLCVYVCLNPIKIDSHFFLIDAIPTVRIARRLPQLAEYLLFGFAQLLQSKPHYYYYEDDYVTIAASH